MSLSIVNLGVLVERVDRVGNWQFKVFISNGCLASEARQTEGRTLVGKYGWEVWVCGQAGRFASLSTYPCRPPAYPSSGAELTLVCRLSGFRQDPKSRQNPRYAWLAFLLMRVFLELENWRTIHPWRAAFPVLQRGLFAALPGPVKPPASTLF